MLFPFFQLLHLAPTVGPISRDSQTPRNSGTNFKLEGENVTGYRYMIHLYCLAVQAGFYSDVVECRTLSPADRVRSQVGEKCYFHFFNCYNQLIQILKQSIHRFTISWYRFWSIISIDLPSTDTDLEV